MCFLMRTLVQHLALDTVEPRLTVTSLLRPLFLAAWQNGHTFLLQKKPSLIRVTAKFFWPIGDRINGVPLY